MIRCVVLQVGVKVRGVRESKMYRLKLLSLVQKYVKQ